MPSAFALSKRYSALTPVFFRRAVLAKYLAEPERYEVGDGDLQCSGFWSLRMDNDHPQHVMAWLKDLGQSLPTSNNPPARSVYRVSNRRTQTPSDPVMVADWAIFLWSVLRSRKILMQNRATLRNALRKRNYESPSVSNDMQSSERLRNSLVLNTNQLLYQLSLPALPDMKAVLAS